MQSSLSASNVSTDTVSKTENINNESCGDKCQVESPKIYEAPEKPVEKTPFWAENPNVLFRSDQITEFFPTEDMSYERKMNAITRTVLMFTIVAILVSPSVRAVLMSVITIAAIYIMFHYHEKERILRDAKKKDNVEGFEANGPVLDLLKYNNLSAPENVFEKPNSSNPFGNVLVTDYDYNPNKKPAPPAANSIVAKDILTQAKKFVGEANPDHPGIADKLFNDIGSELMFEQSLRPFTSNPSTTIPNDQGAFADFCYGSMISCKEGNQFACARNLSRHIN